MVNSTDRIVPLDQLDDFKVAEGDPDVRGWEVLAADGRKIGEVDNLLVDPAAMKVRYLDVDIDDEHLTDGADRHILIPIGYARLDEDDDQIFVDSLNTTNLHQIPAYRHETLTRDFETDLRKHFDSGYSQPAAAKENFYADEVYSDDRFYGSRRNEEGAQRITRSEEQLNVGKREHRAGEVTVDKHVETEHVRESVPTRHEEAVVERRPVQPGMGANARITDDEIHIPLTEEELVVNKRTVPKEEIVVRKREVIENETVEADLKREQVDVRREGNVNVRDDR